MIKNQTLAKNTISALTTAVLLFAASGFVQAQETSKTYQVSYELEAAGKYRAAADKLNTLQGVDRSSYVFHLRQGWLLYLAQDYNGAITAYKSAVKAKPKAIEPRLGLMLPQMALRRWVDVEKSARQALQHDPMNYLAQSRLAYALYNLGRFKDSEVYYRKLHVLYPGDVDMAAGLAWAVLKQGRAGDAVVLFREILQIAPNHASAREGLGVAQKGG